MDIVSFLIGRARADSTKKTYKYARKPFLAFCKRFGYDEFDVRERTLLYFVAFQFKTTTIKWPTMKVQVAAVKAMWLTEGLDNVRREMPALSDAMKGFRRERDEPSNTQPLRLRHLTNMVALLDKESGSAVMACALVVGVFAMLRVGELVSASPSRRWIHTISRENISWRGRDGRLHSAVIRLPTSKSNQFKDKLHRVVIVCTCRLGVCGLHRLWHYLMFQSNVIKTGPVFRDMRGNFLSCRKLNECIRRLTRELGLDPTLYSGRSLRIAGASYMELANIPIRVIQKMGRWSAESKTFQRFYSKMDIQETEAFLERHLAEVDSGNSRVPLP